MSIVPIPGITGLTVRGEQRSYESSLLLLPTPQVWGNDILIETPSQGYKSADYQILFEKSNFQYGYERYQLIGNLTADLGGKYLVFVSSRSVKMRGFSFLSLYRSLFIL